MDLVFDATDSTAVSDPRTELSAFFRRHAVTGSDVSGAELGRTAGQMRSATPRVQPGYMSSGARCGHVSKSTTSVLASSSGHCCPRTHVVTIPRVAIATLPAPEEAATHGGFGSQPFLRALIVELARAVESQAGPDVAEAAVAQAGANVGGRMEEEYRTARKIVGVRARGTENRIKRANGVYALIAPRIVWKSTWAEGRTRRCRRAFLRYSDRPLHGRSGTLCHRRPRRGRRFLPPVLRPRARQSVDDPKTQAKHRQRPERVRGDVQQRPDRSK